MVIKGACQETRLDRIERNRYTDGGCNSECGHDGSHSSSPSFVNKQVRYYGNNLSAYQSAENSCHQPCKK